MGHGQTRTVSVTGVASGRAGRRHAVVLNVTASAPSFGGFLTVFPADVTVPRSNINWNPRQIIPTS